METTQSNKSKYAEVIVNASINKILDYEIPEHLLLKIKIGSCVQVSLRGTNKISLVTKIKNETNFSKIFPINNILDNICLPEDLIHLIFWISKYYLTPLGKVLKLFLPMSIQKETKLKQKIFVSSKKTKKELNNIIKEIENSSPHQVIILKNFLKKKIIPLKELLDSTNLTKKDLLPLINQGILNIFKDSIFSSLNSAEIITPEKNTLNSEQTLAYKKIEDSLLKNTFKVHLLFGVTGSGKTEIYLKTIQKCLDLNKSAIILVPEISLIPQLSEKLRSYFQTDIGIIHYRLSEGEKRDVWLKCLNYKIKILLGARSALFYPMQNLGAIIVDEEHDFSYKQQEDTPTYHGRDVAIMRAKIANCVAILGSATPSLESYTNALNNKYILSKLTTKPKLSPDLKVSIINMNDELAKNKSPSLISNVLITKIKDRLNKGEQSIIFLNRRGFHTRLTCSSCQYTYNCEHCNITLIYHKQQEKLSCHLCGFSLLQIPKQCKHCSKSTSLVFQGIGTEKVENSLKAIFPEIKTIRIDADTTKQKDSLSHLLKHFSTGKADILIGTQMISKGLHFPLVTLSVILNADSGLLIPDFRSSEMVFQLITQVAGRSGRELLAGEVLIQTFNPENFIIKASSKQNYEDFYNEEIISRKLLNFPPFSRMVKIIFSSKSLEVIQKEGFDFFSLVKKHAENHKDIFVYPFIPCGYIKIKDSFRYQFLIRSKNILIINHLLQNIFQKYPFSSKIKYLVDIEPSSTFF